MFPRRNHPEEADDLESLCKGHDPNEEWNYYLERLYRSFVRSVKQMTQRMSLIGSIKILFFVIVVTVVLAFGLLIIPNPIQDIPTQTNALQANTNHPPPIHRKFPNASRPNSAPPNPPQFNSNRFPLTGLARDDLIECFSPFYKGQGVWADADKLSKNGEFHPYSCKIHGVGHFRIMTPGRKTRIIESLDEHDHGTKYLMKHSPSYPVSLTGRRESEIIQLLSQTEKSAEYTARAHPRYPFLEWKMRDNKTAQIIVMEYLKNSKDRVFESEETLLSFLVQCWNDVQNVREVLWEKRLVHNDIHAEQWMISKKENEDIDHCHMIDFQKMLSLDKPEDYMFIRHAETSPMWKRIFLNPNKRMEYVKQHGLNAFHQRAWEWKTMQWSDIIFVSRLVKFLERTEGWHAKKLHYDGIDGSWRWMKFQCDKRDQAKALVLRFEQRKAKGILINLDFLELMVNYSSILHQELEVTNVKCDL